MKASSQLLECEEYNRLKIEGNSGIGELILVKGGPKLAYLWMGHKNGVCVGTISGEKVLLALAEAILDELKPAPKRRTRR